MSHIELSDMTNSLSEEKLSRWYIFDVHFLYFELWILSQIPLVSLLGCWAWRQAEFQGLVFTFCSFPCTHPDLSIYTELVPSEHKPQSTTASAFGEPRPALGGMLSSSSLPWKSPPLVRIGGVSYYCMKIFLSKPGWKGRKTNIIPHFTHIYGSTWMCKAVCEASSSMRVSTIEKITVL